MRQSIAAAFALLLTLAPHAASAQPVDKATVSHAPSLINLPLYVAQANGFFAREGLEVQLVLLAAGTEAATALLSSSVDFVATSIDKIALLRNRGQTNVKAIVGLQSQPTQSLVLRKDLEGKFPAADIKSLAGKGLRLGISTPGSGTDVGLRSLLKYYRVDPDKDVQIIATRGQTDVAIAALVQGSIDGFFFPEPGPTQAVQMNLGFRFLDYSKEGPESLRRVAYTAMLTRDDIIEKKPAIAEKLVRAVARAADAMRKDPRIAIAAAHEYVSKQLPAELIGAVVAQGAPYFTPDIPKQNVEILVKSLVDGGQIKTSYGYSDLVSTKFEKAWTP